MKSRSNTFKGVVGVCAHRVVFKYDLEKHKLTDELEDRLFKEAERRSKELIIEGYRTGELHCGLGDYTISGYWEIVR